MNDEFRMEQRTVNQAGESLGRYTAKTFGWMFAGLLITLIVAISMYVTGAFIYVIRIPAWNFLLLAAELILVISLSARLEKLSVTAAKSMFFLYSAVNGIVFSLYFLMFDLLSKALKSINMANSQKTNRKIRPPVIKGRRAEKLIFPKYPISAITPKNIAVIPNAIHRERRSNIKKSRHTMLITDRIPRWQQRLPFSQHCSCIWISLTCLSIFCVL